MAYDIIPLQNGDSLTNGSKTWRYTGEELLAKIIADDFPNSSYMNVSATYANDSGVQEFFPEFTKLYLSGDDNSVVFDISSLILPLVYNFRKIVPNINSLDYNQISIPYDIGLIFGPEESNNPSDLLLCSFRYIHGGRPVQDRTPLDILGGFNSNDYQRFGVDQIQYSGYPIIDIFFNDVTLPIDESITVTTSYPTNGECLSGKYIIWRSPLGGYNTFGFDDFSVIDNRTQGEAKITQTDVLNGNLYNEDGTINYRYKRSYTLRSTDVPKGYLRVLQTLTSSNEIYVLHKGQNNDNLELCRLTNINVPVNTLSDGESVSITLESLNVQRGRIF